MRTFIPAVIGAGALAASLLLVSGAEAFPAKPAAGHPTASNVVLAAAKQPAAKFRRAKVRLETNEKPGTIIVNTVTKYLYYIQGNNRAIRYGIGVGRDGFGWSGVVHIGRKAEWPDWTPPREMVLRERRHGHNIPTFVEGGENNPLGARAMYLYRNGHDTMYRIHGTNQPSSIGLNMSSGCIRMMNADVTDLYARASVGAKVIVIGPGNRQGDIAYSDNGVDILHTLFGG